MSYNFLPLAGLIFLPKYLLNYYKNDIVKNELIDILGKFTFSNS